MKFSRLTHLFTCLPHLSHKQKNKRLSQTVWAPCGNIIHNIIFLFHRSTQPEKRRQISPHDERQGADASRASTKAQIQFRQRAHFGRKVLLLPTLSMSTKCHLVLYYTVRTANKTFFTLCFRRERALSKSLANSVRRSSGFSIPESPTSTWSPTASPTHLIPSPVYSTPVMDEPLALIKKPRPEPEKTESQSKATTVRQTQVTVLYLKACEMRNYVMHSIIFNIYNILSNNI